MFSFLKTKSTAFLILVIALSISLSNFSNTFTALSGAIFNAPKASASTVQISENALPSNVRLCAQDVGASGTQRTDVTNGASLTGSVNGTEYKLFTTTLNNCTGSNTTDYTAVTGTFFVLSNHVTTLAFTGNAAPYGLTATYDNNAPRYNGDTTFSICQGDSRFINILVTDSDNDVLNGAFTVANTSDAFVTVTYPQNGQVNYQIEPKSSFYNTQNTTSGNITLNTTQSNLSTNALTTSVFGGNAAVSTVVSLRTVQCPNGIPAASKSSSIISSSSSISNYYYNNTFNGQTYSCFGGNYQNEIFNNYFYGAIVGAICNIYWSGYFYPSSGPINYYPPAYPISSSIYVSNPSSLTYSSILQSTSNSNSTVRTAGGPVSSSQSINSSILSSSLVTLPAPASSIANNPTSYSISPNCPVSVNDSRNYYGGGRISMFNNSNLASGNLSANINLPTGVTVSAVEKGYNFYQNGNNLNVSFPDVGPYGEIAALYTTNYTGPQYNSSAVINCNQEVQPRLYSGYVPPATPVNIVSSKVSSSSVSSIARDQGTLDARSSIVAKEICGTEIFEKLDSCDCPLPREVFATSTEVDSFRICKLPERSSSSSVFSLSSEQVSSSLSSKSSSLSSKPITVIVSELTYCNSPNLTLSSDKKFCVCPNTGDLIYINKDANGKEEYICKTTVAVQAVVATQSSSISSQISSSSSTAQLAKGCQANVLVLSQDGKECVCPNAGQKVVVKIGSNGMEETVCEKIDLESVSSSQSSLSSAVFSSSQMVVASAQPASVGGVITIGGIGGISTTQSSSVQNSSSSQNNSSVLTSVEVLRQSGQLSMRNIPETCDETTKINGICPTSGTLAAREVPASSKTGKLFGLDDPYKCGGNLKGKITNSATKSVRYELFKNGQSTSSFNFDVPVNSDGSFELKIDYSKVPEDVYKIVLSADNNGTLITETIEEYVTKNCNGVDALKYYANKTVRTGGQGLVPVILVLFGIITLIGAVKFATANPRSN